MRDAIRREDAAEHHPAFLDLRKIPFPENGVSAPDPYTLVIRIRGKYPQFQDWLTMSFFAPVPWEAEARIRDLRRTVSGSPGGRSALVPT